MPLHKNKLYSIMLIACAVGYVWIYFSITQNLTEHRFFTGCLVKHTTNIPCPSCGSTRSIISLVNGNFTEAVRINPAGIVVAGIMILAPLWIFIDILTKKKTLFDFYQKMETHIKKPQFAIPLILLVIINWVWNITKEL